ncbi:MAG TPA: hypothetical protein VK974_07165 [Methylophilaceae bacterium]|nr:hypothetical protein [Methylophilaceae bacterium]
MLNPLPDTDSLLQELNGIRLTGVILTYELKIRKLKKAIDALKDDIAEYHMFLASLYCLTGETEKMKYHGNISMQHANAGQIIYHSVTLGNSGFFSESRNLIDLLTEDNFIIDDKPDIHLINMSLANQAYKMVLPIVNKYKTTELPLAASVHQTLQKYDIAEKTILSMLDIAGTVLRDHNLIKNSDLVIIYNDRLEVLNISIPVSLQPTEMVDIEWEFMNKLFTQMPEAPVQNIHIGFTSVQT